MIVLIPIIVAIALTATSRVIAITTPDNPFGIEIRDSNNKVIERNDIINVDIDDLNAFIIVDVLPLMTKNSKINPPKIEEGSIGDVEIVRRGDTNRYSVIPKKVGPVKVIISAAANVNVTRAVVFNITSNSIESLVVFDDEGKELLSGNIIEVRNSGQLHLEISPIEALKDDIVAWRVVNGDSVSITPNGYLTINSRGISEVRAMAKDKNGNQPYITLVFDTRSAIIKNKKVYVEEENVTPTYIREVFTLDPEHAEVTIEENAQGDLIATVIHTDKDTGYITEDTIQVIITNRHAWDFIEGPTILYANNTPYFLGVKDLLTGEKIEKGVTFTADPSKAIIDKETGAMFPLVPGELVVTAKRGREEKQIIFTVKERVPTFELELGLEDAMSGIQLTRKWGTYWLDENYELTNKYRFGLSSKNNTYEVRWSTSDSSVISIEQIEKTEEMEDTQDIILTFHEEGVGKSAVISATFMLYNRPVENIKRSFEFKLMDTPDYINVTKFDELWHMSIEEKYNACLQSDIIAPKQLVFNVGISFYGNGFLYDASEIPSVPLSTGAINVFRLKEHYEGKNLEVPAGKEIVDNTTNEKSLVFEEMRMRNTVSMENGNMLNRGDAISLFGFYRGGVKFKYMQVFNTDRGIYCLRVRNIMLEGCILGDNETYSLYLFYPPATSGAFEGDRGTLILKNNVIKNSRSGAGIFMTYYGSYDLEDLASGYMPNISIEGFLDIYNWHTEESFAKATAKIAINAILEFSSMPAEKTENLLTLLENLLLGALNEYVAAKNLEHLYYVHRRTKYISLGMFACGLIFNPGDDACSRVISEDDRITSLVVPVIDEKGEYFTPQFAGLANLVDMMFPGMISMEFDNVLICPNYQGGNEPDSKPGDPVPHTYELYARLTGNPVDFYK